MRYEEIPRKKWFDCADDLWHWAEKERGIEKWLKGFEVAVVGGAEGKVDC